MSSSKGGGPEWDRLGKLLEQRRVEMNPRYRDLTLFAEERGLNWRLAWDIEKNRRTSYRDLTLSAIEVGYGWAPGSIRRVLGGGDPELAARPAPEFTPEQVARIASDFAKMIQDRTADRTEDNGEGRERPA
jgi:hypothetical protein